MIIFRKKPYLIVLIFNCIDVLKMIIEYKQEQKENLNLGSIELSHNSGWTFAIPIQL